MTKLMEALKARGGTAKKVEIDISRIGQWEKVFARQFTMADREWMMEAMKVHGSGKDIVMLPTMVARCRQIVRSLVDEDGARIFTDLDVGGLMKECRDSDVTAIGEAIDEAFPANITTEDAVKN